MLLAQEREHSIHYCVECGRNRPCRFYTKQQKWFYDRHAKEIFRLPRPAIRPKKRDSTEHLFKPNRPNRGNVVNQCVVCYQEFAPPRYREHNQTCGNPKCVGVYRGRQVSLAFHKKQEEVEQLMLNPTYLHR